MSLHSASRRGRSLVLLAGLAALACQPARTGPATGWDSVKRIQTPVSGLLTEFEKPVRQQLANLAWEDGLYISRDGLTLYCTYFPGDLLSFAMDGIHLENFDRYRRGPEIGQDFTKPPGWTTPWMHADVAMSRRASVEAPFTKWELSELHGKTYNLGGVQGIPNKAGGFELLVYTYDSRKGPQTKLMRNVGRELASDSLGEWLPDNVSDQRYHEDNPHIERASDAHPAELVLFFDSDNWPGLGQHDLFYCLSHDNGKTWDNPKPVTSIDTPGDEQQPHLFRQEGQWWLYFSATNPADNKLGIFRAEQQTPGDWEHWGARELVVGAGTTVAVGEPTLTAAGDLSFVAITQNVAGGTSTDRYDCDPWFLKRRR